MKNDPQPTEQEPSKQEPEIIDSWTHDNLVLSIVRYPKTKTVMIRMEAKDMWSREYEIHPDICSGLAHRFLQIRGEVSESEKLAAAQRDDALLERARLEGVIIALDGQVVEMGRQRNEAQMELQQLRTALDDRIRIRRRLEHEATIGADFVWGPSTMANLRRALADLGFISNGVLPEELRSADAMVVAAVSALVEERRRWIACGQALVQRIGPQAIDAERMAALPKVVHEELVRLEAFEAEVAELLGANRDSASLLQEIKNIKIDCDEAARSARNVPVLIKIKAPADAQDGARCLRTLAYIAEPDNVVAVEVVQRPDEARNAVSEIHLRSGQTLRVPLIAGVVAEMIWGERAVRSQPFAPVIDSDRDR